LGTTSNKLVSQPFLSVFDLAENDYLTPIVAYSEKGVKRKLWNKQGISHR